MVNLVNDMITDFNMLKTLNLHSKRLNPGTLSKFWVHIKKTQALQSDEKADFFTFKKLDLWHNIRGQTVTIKKKVNCSVKADFDIILDPEVPEVDVRAMSQNPNRTLHLWGSVQRHIETTHTLQQLCIND